MLVRHADDPDRVPGHVVDVDVEERELCVEWEDDDGEGEWYPVEHLRLYEEHPLPNLSQVEAPQVQEYEFLAQRDPETGTMVPVRDSSFDPTVPGPVIRSPADIYEHFQHMGDLASEHIVVVSMNVRRELLGWEVVHKGHLASVEASPRKMLTGALVVNAHSIALLHNHPSGACSPSGADDELTAHMVAMGEMFEMPLFDHVVVGRERFGEEADGPYYSYRESGAISEEDAA